jgi:hypothetical protein
MSLIRKPTKTEEDLFCFNRGPLEITENARICSFFLTAEDDGVNLRIMMGTKVEESIRQHENSSKF